MSKKKRIKINFWWSIYLMFFWCNVFFTLQLFSYSFVPFQVFFTEEADEEVDDASAPWLGANVCGAAMIASSTSSYLLCTNKRNETKWKKATTLHHIFIFSITLWSFYSLYSSKYFRFFPFRKLFNLHEKRGKIGIWRRLSIHSFTRLS